MELIQKEASAIQRSDPVIVAEAEQIMALPLSRLEKRLSLNSMLDDLDIIEDAARLIMKVKEELIGPAREQAPRPTMLDDVLKDTINNLAISPGVITENHEENLPLVLADPLQLSRVFANLLTNAIEAMVQQPQPQISLDLRCSPSKEFVQVTIADNGTGIAEPDLDKIWITFHTTKGMKGHPGLGLPACRLILQQIGGNISVASTPGQGAIFTVNIPVDTSTAAKSKGPAGKGRILIIDDDDRWRHFAVTTLETAGYKVACADEDIRVDNYAPCDLIVIDDNLAYRDSLTLLREIKKGGAISKTVAVSSNPRVERTKERILLGIQNFLPKPYIRVSLLNEIRTALRAVR
jgi:CheY-like chemotaxis protein